MNKRWQWSGLNYERAFTYLEHNNGGFFGRFNDWQTVKRIYIVYYE